MQTETSQNGTVKDIDGNIYKTVKIGTQTWMGENLKTTKFNDGKLIPLVTDNKAWSNLLTPGYCWYNNDAITNKDIYGALYNGYTVSIGKLCPIGYHVPNKIEFLTLLNFVGGDIYSSYDKLKESGILHWNSPNSGATNVVNFSAVPGGYRIGSFLDIHQKGMWWISPNNQGEYSMLVLSAKNDYDDLSNAIFFAGGSLEYGYSVRCVKN